MAAQHTPGPWSYGTRGSDHGAAEICTLYGVPALPTEDGKGQTWGFVIAHTPCWQVDAAEREANARLIAAAPAMLADLRRDLAFARSVVSYLRAIGDTKDVMFTSAQSAVRRLRAAIDLSTKNDGEASR